jgi:two-component system response regulator CpxR
MKRTATWRGERLQLTSAEFNILAVLAENTGQIVAKGELSRRALGRSLERYDRSLDMHVSNLRHKLPALEDGRSPIQTVHGAGYLLLRE